MNAIFFSTQAGERSYLHQSGLQVRASNSSLSEPVGLGLYGKTVAILGVGRMGAACAIPRPPRRVAL